MNVPYTFHNKLVLRTPVKELTKNLSQIFELQKILHDKEFMEAVFVASPVLYNAWLKYAAGDMVEQKEIKKLTLSLAKYYLRMGSRCTPFGLFSGCGVAEWSVGATAIKMNNNYRHTRFDMHYLCALARHLSTLPFIKNKLLHFPNSSFYKLGNEIRYVEYKYNNGKRHHLITAVLASNYLLDILKHAKNGTTTNAIIHLLVSDDIDVSEATDFVTELIDSQLLVNELEPAVTGDEFLYQIIATLKKLKGGDELNKIIELLESIENLLSNIDTGKNHFIENYSAINSLVKQFNIPFDESKLFQTDLSFSLSKNSINAVHQNEIIQTLSIINKLNNIPENTILSAFAKRFYERYEDAEMPLLEVLDTENGIGYLEKKEGSVMPLIDDVMVMGKVSDDHKITWSKKDKFLLQKLTATLVKNNYSVELNEDELKDFKNDWSLFPPSMGVMFRLLNDDKIFIENVGGSSAANLLGRFAHGNKEIAGIVNDIVAEEEKQNPDIIFAEIAHLPESRTGNILLHPAFRKYEIPFLSKSSVANECQIPLQDLFISVKKNSIILRSKKLNKQIIPRLSTAHNYSAKALPVYQFLCDLQLQGKQIGIHFNWGALEGLYKFLPRVTYKNCIVFSATWYFEKKDIENIIKAKDDEIINAITEFKAKWKMPSLTVLADSDNELLINLDDTLMLQIWFDAVKNRNGFTIKEFLGATENTSTQNKNGAIRSNQFIASLLRNTVAHIPVTLPIHKNANNKLQQSFSIGSEWLYFKIYCGTKSADTILTHAILHLVNKLLAQKNIHSFFFIRFNDPNFHLRLRFKISDIKYVGEVIKLLHNFIKPFEDEKLIWKIQADTYKRELDRYGNTAILQSEELFFYDSMSALYLLKQADGDEREQLRWLCCIKGIDDLLNDFELHTNEKYLLLEQIKNSFHAEYNTDKFLKDQLTNKYRTYRIKVEDILNNKNSFLENMDAIEEIFSNKSATIKKIASAIQELHNEGKLEITIAALLTSYIHMLVNRLIAANPRLHELVMYDMLYTYYKSLIAKEKYSTVNGAFKNKVEIVC